jgi:hypothetical protein
MGKFGNYRGSVTGATDDDPVREIRTAGYGGPVVSPRDLDLH